MRPINLLPPEVAKERTRRRRILLVALLAVAYVLLLVAGVFYWDTRVDSARKEITAQEESNRLLERELAALGDAGALQAEYLSKVVLVEQALASDVDWGVILNDLARLLPPRVWVETFNGTVTQGVVPGVLGQVSFSGVGFDFPDVSAWIRTLDSEDFVGITGSWVSTASQGNIGEEEVVTFTSTAVLTDAAGTNRAADLIPDPEAP
jgi:Tfp pilus assembly protein PilN